MEIQLNRLFVILSILLLSSTFLPAYAEVTSLKINAPFYKGGSKIYFTGTTLGTDPRYVTVVINNPNNEFVLLLSGISDSSDHTFQIIVDTSSQENQHKFSLKGIYNATAFIANKTAGKTVNFIFSPDGSPMVPSQPTNLKATPVSSTEIDLSWIIPLLNGGSTINGYKIERNDGSGFKVIQNTQTTTYQDTGLTPSKQYSYRVSAINSAGTSNPSNTISATTLSAPTQTNSGSHVPPVQNNAGASSQTTSDNQSIDELIKQRIENAKRLQQLLKTKSNKISLYENMGITDLSGKAFLSQIPNFGSILPSFTFNNLLYPLMVLAGVGVIVAVIIVKKNGLWFNPSFKSMDIRSTSDSMESEKQDDVSVEEDYSLLILKNRLAKGEITIEEYNRLKDALRES